MPTTTDLLAHHGPIAHGFLLALGLVLPLGPQNLFVLGQGASHRRLIHAMPAAITAALCDTILIALAIGGVSTAVVTIPGVRLALLVFGILFLGYLGWTSWTTRALPVGDEPNNGYRSLASQVGFACSVSLMNPHAILDTVAVIGTSSLSYTLEADRLGFAVTCVAVSWCWFFTLVVAGRLAGRVSVVRSSMNRVSAVLMWATAGYLVTQL